MYKMYNYINENYHFIYNVSISKQNISKLKFLAFPEVNSDKQRERHTLYFKCLFTFLYHIYAL